MSLTRVTLGVGWEAEVGVGESRGKEEIQAKRKEKKSAPTFRPIHKIVSVCIRTEKANKKFKHHKISSFVEYHINILVKSLGVWLGQLVEPATLDLGVVNSGPRLGVEIT